jgi:hypothetical protein
VLGFTDEATVVLLASNAKAGAELNSMARPVATISAAPRTMLEQIPTRLRNQTPRCHANRILNLAQGTVEHWPGANERQGVA